MQNIKLFRLLKTLSPLEFKVFGDFVFSPFFNKSSKLKKLYKFLETCYPDFKSKDIDHHVLFFLMYPDDIYNEKKLRDRLSLMFKLTENYLSHLEFKRRTFEKKSFLLNQLSHRKLDTLFESEMQSAIDYVEKIRLKDENYYFKKYILDNLKRKFLETRTQAGKMQPVYDNLLSENDNLIIFFLISLLNNNLTLKDAEGLINISHRYRIYDGILVYIENEIEHFNNFPAIKILYSYFNFNKAKPGSLASKTRFKKLKELINENENVLSEDCYKMIYTGLYNYCKYMQSKGDKEAGRESFEITKVLLSKNLHLETDGSLHPHNYINISATALRVNELEWAEDFINANKDMIRPALRDNAFNFNSASLYYIKGRRNKELREKYHSISLSHLSRVNKDDFYYYTRIKNLEMRIYYELKNYKQVLCIIDSYRKVLKGNDKIPDNLKTSYCNFINFLHRMINMIYSDNHKSFKRLKDDLEKEEDVAFKEWINEKIDEMEGEG